MKVISGRISMENKKRRDLQSDYPKCREGSGDRHGVHVFGKVVH